MSVIRDALKAAQRERAHRESQGAPAVVAPILVRLRSKPQSTGGSRRMIVIVALGGTLVGAATFVGWQLNRKPALPAVPPLTSTILSEALAADSSVTRLETRVAPAAVPGAVRDTTQRLAATPEPASVARQSPSPVRREAPLQRVATAAPADTGAIPQGQPLAAPSGSPDRSPGRLRVAVERSGHAAVAALFNEAVAAHRAGDVQTARQLYDSVLVLAPADPDAMNNLAVILSSQKEFGRALDLLRRAATIAPRKAEIWNNLGTVYREQGKNGDAIAAYRQALSIDAGHPGAKVGLAQQYIAIKSFPQAKVLLEEVTAVHPQLSEAHYTLGQVLEQMQDPAGAVVAYEAFIRTAPERLAPYAELVKRRVETLKR